MISNNKFSHDEYGYPRTNEEIRLLEQNEQSDNIIKRLQSQIASLESQLRDKERVISEYRTMLSPMWEWAENNDSFKLGESITKRILEMAKSSVEKDKEIEAFKDIENIRSQATKSVCKENYDLRDEIERLNAIRDNIIHITFGAGSHQERIRLIKDALKIS